MTQSWNRLRGRGLAKGRSKEEIARDLADETADVLGHILLFARENGLDLDAAVERKWRFRRNRRDAGFMTLAFVTRAKMPAP